MKKFVAIMMAISAFSAPVVSDEQAPVVPADLELWRLECGNIYLANGSIFSDVHLFDGQPRALAGSCYLIRHGEEYLLWDAGLPTTLIGAPTSDHGVSLSLDRSVVDQINELGIGQTMVSKVAISHYHFDHAGQLLDFPMATLVISEKDWAVVSSGDDAPYFTPSLFAPWVGEDEGKVLTFAKDLDVFGDGSVVIKATPGHTPGHTSLLVRLPETGDVLLTGDLYHFQEQASAHSVPQYNYDRGQTLSSMARFDQTAEVLEALVVIQHDPNHVDRLPTFPKSAK